jgi:selenocysteine lyase/cysteine desulfurase
MQTTDTRDFPPYLAIVDAIDFRNKFGEQKIVAYIHSLAQIGGRRLANTWGTNVLGLGADHSLIDVAMTNVRLPVTTPLPDSSILTPAQLANSIFSNYHTWVPIFEFEGAWYCRISAQIYNEESDIIYYGNAVITTLHTFNVLAPGVNH